MSKELKLKLLQVSTLAEQVAEIYSNNLEDLEVEEEETRRDAQKLAQEADSMDCRENTRGLWEKQGRAQAAYDVGLRARDTLQKEIDAITAELSSREEQLQEAKYQLGEWAVNLRDATTAYADSKAPYLSACKAATTAFVLSVVTSAIAESARNKK